MRAWVHRPAKPAAHAFNAATPTMLLFFLLLLGLLCFALCPRSLIIFFVYPKRLF
jgi:hypothetical protein